MPPLDLNRALRNRVTHATGMPSPAAWRPSSWRPHHEAQSLRQALAEYFTDAVRESLTVDSICLFVQERPGVPFRLARRQAFLAVSLP